MKNTIKRIHGEITLISPLNVAAVGEYHTVLNEKGWSYPQPGKGPAGMTSFPVTATQTMRVVIPLSIREARALDENSETKIQLEETVPYVPSNSIRGRLRRATRDVVFEILQEAGQKVSLGTYHGMSCGAVTGQPGKRTTFSYVQEARRHPFLGLFGGGPRLVPSSLTVMTAWPIIPVTTETGMVPARFASELDGTPRLRNTLFTRRLDDALMAQGVTSMEKHVEDYSKAVVDWQAVIGDNKKGDRSKAKIESFTGVEVLAPGTRLYLGMDVDTAHIGDAGFGLFLMGLSQFKRAEGRTLGGMSRIGFGQYKVSWTDDAGQNLFTEDGSPNEDLPEVKRAIDAWSNAEVDAATLERLYAQDKSEESEEPVS